MVDKRTSRLIVRTTPEELGRWEATAKAEGVTLADLVRSRMTGEAKHGPRSNTAVPVLHRQIEELNAAGDVMRKTIKMQAEKIDLLVAQGLGRSSGQLPTAVPRKKGARPQIGSELLGNPVLKDPVPRNLPGQVAPRFKASAKVKQI